MAEIIGNKPSMFDEKKGFTVTNNTSQNVYVETGTDTYETVGAGKTSKAHKATGDYPVRNSASNDGKIYLTVKVDSSDGTVTLESGTLKGSFAITTHFA